MPSPEEAHAYTKRMPVIGICLAVVTDAPGGCSVSRRTAARTRISTRLDEMGYQTLK